MYLLKLVYYNSAIDGYKGNDFYDGANHYIFTII